MSALPKPDLDRYAPMVEADLHEVVAIETDIYPFPWTRGNFLDSVRSGYSVWVLRDRQAALVAYAVMTLMIDEAHLLNLSVARASQREGVGWRTLEWMAEVARGYGARTMLLEVRPSNASAVRMYERYGFEKIGVRRGYYPAASGREDAVVMRVSL
ncbi:MAG TPA: ribosomal protein S18-alanine N-acetyltransferase [Burkholderiaceae bacterium]|nr:ribosomal protein S18-alanine N-acetyltransferase [Burkholderiaceae bacterium]